MANKTRLDKVIGQRYPALSRSKIQELITQGAVTVNGTIITRSNFLVLDSATIELDTTFLKYVSRAGLKLEYALQHFNICVKDLICLDAGLSTGGFTDCLLQHGARKVYGVDVGTAQVDPKIAQDPRVVIMENTDIRNIITPASEKFPRPLTLSEVEGSKRLPELVDIITLDLSFISITKVIEHVTDLIKPGGILITLIKPQFEVGREAAHAASGVIKDNDLQQATVQSVIKSIESAGFDYKNLTESPILGGSGNKEFLAYFVKKL
jgi:23S rRNA (cytidine1920-2'-O)/16S rRNA (cytidine1409-2'-O)-methyltransferase